jgi:hypothetical protein
MSNNFENHLIERHLIENHLTFDHLIEIKSIEYRKKRDEFEQNSNARRL